MIDWLRADERRTDLLIAAVTVAMAMLLILGAPDDFDTGWPEWAAGVGAFVMLMIRRRAPLVLLVVALAWTALHIGVLQRPTPMIFAVLVLLVTVCIRLERWLAIALGASMATSLYVLGLISNDAELGDARAVIGVAWTAGAVGIADAIRSWRSYRESADAQLRAAVLATEAQAREQVSEERLAIAREVHDLLAHNLSVMNVQTAAALHLVRTDPDQAEQSLRTAREAGRTVLDELREMLSVLRSPDDGDAPTTSLPTVDELDRLVETMRSAGLEVGWRRTGAVRTLAPAVSLAAYRIVQEALTNAAKHGVGTAELSTSWTADGLAIEVTNDVGGGDGSGSHEPGGSGHGLIGMRERAVANGGRLAVDRTEGRFVVEAWLPNAPDHEMAP